MNSAPVKAQATTQWFPQLFGHPRPLWMLFMTEFWERFAFYSVSWALTLYIVAQFYHGDPAGQLWASKIYGAYTALIYAASIFGGYAADKLIGYQRAILIGALTMALGLVIMMVPDKQVFLLGLAMVIVGDGLFKPNISTMVGQLYGPTDARRDRGFILFYMGINLGSLLAPLLTGWLASHYANTSLDQNYKLVFAAAAVGMVLSWLWFWFGRRGLRDVGRPAEHAMGYRRVAWVLGGIILATPLTWALLMFVSAVALQWLIGVLFIGVAIGLMIEAARQDRVQLQRVLAMLIIFGFSILFYMFYFQLGTSFNFLAQNMIDRHVFGRWTFPVGWFQSINPLAVIVLAPVLSQLWGMLARRRLEPDIPRKFGIGLISNSLGFVALIYALGRMLDKHDVLLPFWPLPLCYLLQSIGELCLSPIGLSMVSKLAPPRLVGVAMGGWFLSLAAGGNLSGLLASHISGASGMTAASALSGFTFSFWLLAAAGVFLWIISPWINRLMHGVR